MNYSNLRVLGLPYNEEKEAYELDDVVEYIENKARTWERQCLDEFKIIVDGPLAFFFRTMCIWAQDMEMTMPHEMVHKLNIRRQQPGGVHGIPRLRKVNIGSYKDVINTMIGWKDDDCKIILEEADSSNTVDEYMKVLTCGVVPYEETETEETDAGPSQTPKKIMKSPKKKASGKTKEENVLLTHINALLFYLRIHKKVNVKVFLNVNTKRKGDPDDVVFTFNDKEYLCGRKSWRSYVKNIAEKYYSSKEGMTRVKKVVSKSFKVPVSDWSDTALLTLYLWALDDDKTTAEFIKEHQGEEVEVPQVQDRSVKEIIKRFTALDSEPCEITDDVKTLNDCVVFVCEHVWGKSREKRKAQEIDDDEEDQEEIPMTQDGNNVSAEQQNVIAALEQLREARTDDGSVVYKTRDGGKFNYHVFFDLLSMLIDMYDIKHHEIILNTPEHVFKKVQDIFGSVVTDPDGETHYVSDLFVTFGSKYFMELISDQLENSRKRLRRMST